MSHTINAHLKRLVYIFDEYDNIDWLNPFFIKTAALIIAKTVLWKQANVKPLLKA